MTPGVFGMIKVRFYVTGQENPVQDHEMVAVPRYGDIVELGAVDGTPIVLQVDEVTWVVHEVVPADVIVTLVPKNK